MQKDQRNLILLLADKALQAYNPPAASPTITLLRDSQRNLPRGFIERTPGRLVISFMGTVNRKDVATDAKFFKAWFFEHRVHRGFKREFDAVWDQVFNVLISTPKDTEILVTGHSLGAAIATLVAYAIKRILNRHPKLVTFGCPRVGNHKFAQAFNKLLHDAIRVVHDRDIVTRIPKLFYWHVHGLLHLSDWGEIVKPSKRWWLNLLSVLRADTSGKSLSDHHMPQYQGAVRAFTFIRG